VQTNLEKLKAFVYSLERGQIYDDAELWYMLIAALEELANECKESANDPRR